MIVSAWNIRGLNKVSKQNSILKFIRTNNIHLCCLLETKMTTTNFVNFSSNRLPSWLSITNFDKIDGGRIGIIWDPHFVHINVLEIDKQHVHLSATCKVTQIEYLVTFVYALYTVLNRKTLWDHLANLEPTINSPWLVMGDFNCVGCPNERVGPTPPSAYNMQHLNDFKVQTNLVDCPSTGQFLTWNRGSLWAKLDRVLINSFWSTLDIECKTHFHDFELESDHVASMVSIGKTCGAASRPFKFFNMWLNHENFNAILTTHWDREVYGSSQFILAKKLKDLKKPLRELNKLHFGHISERVKDSKKEYKRLLGLSILSPLDETIKEELLLIKKKLLNLKVAEEDFFKQKAKANHLVQSDKCTKYFHAIVKKNMARNSITALKLQNGISTTSIDQVATELVNFYTNLFGAYYPTSGLDPSVVASGRCLPASATPGLVAPITDLEIKEALFDIGDNKSPGPDGYTSAFFKKKWNTVGFDFTRAVRGFFGSGRLLKQTNHTVIALIPKTNHSPTPADFRPIACTNVVYKVITKIISKRMIPCLPDLIDHAQGAFVDGRLMIDNVFVAQELIKGYSRKRASPRCMIKVDLRKAYDTISWDFLAAMLTHLGFPGRFIHWIMECVTTPSYSISINGVLHGHFEGKRGLRQGDPMSPLLFVLCLEYFSRLLNIRTKNPMFKHHPLCGSLNISHVAYADDLMLFSRGDTTSIQILTQALEDFGNISGLRVNYDKSNIFLGGNAYYDLDTILELVDFKIGTFPVKYLGVPLAPLKLSVAQYAPLLESITTFINAWSIKSLSYAGRVELIKSVIQGVHSFWLHMFPIPNVILDRITSICRIFLWGSKFARVAWADICLPKEEGGLGIHDTKVWNKALLSKTFWDIHTKKDTLWVKWVHGVYLKGRCVWEFVPHERDSQLFKKIAQIRDEILSKFQDIPSAILGLSAFQMNGKLVSSKVYDLLRPRAATRVWMPFIWKDYIPPKFSFVTWLAFRNRLATCDNLHRLDVDNTCVLCKGGPETVPHLYFECFFSGKVWAMMKAWIGIPRMMGTLASAVKWIKKERSGASVRAKAARIAFSCTIYSLWRVRNAARFDDFLPKEEEVFARIQYVVYKILYCIYPYDLVVL
ncbi:unnamed protein product [Cuscuta epithymum]|uniref:Reverse transcriptase domain-containing protein n=1 Tax=Cuscuta epithymum TaxID=186058 RepID=A0AAV0GCY0_9ASTE|nr:unnamed protein product [Cuscuta epithymum]